MPKKGTRSKSKRAKAAKHGARTRSGRLSLSQLPYQPDLVIEGGVRTLLKYVTDGRELVQPRVAIWLDGESGIIRTYSMLLPSTPEQEARDNIESLVQAMTGPFLPVPSGESLALLATIRGGQAPQSMPRPPRPGLPGTIRINDPTFADAARELLANTQVTVEYAERIPTFDEAFEQMSAGLGPTETEPPPPFDWDIDVAILRPLYQAAATLARAAPWEYIADYPPVGIDLGDDGPESGVTHLYASVMGALGEFVGVALYYSPDGLDRTVEQGSALLDASDEELDVVLEIMERAGIPVGDIEPSELRTMAAEIAGQGPERDEEITELIEDTLLLAYDSAREHDPSYLDWLKRHGISVMADRVPTFTRTVRGGEARLPTAQEACALLLALEALNAFFKHHKATLQRSHWVVGTLEHVAQVESPSGTTAIHVYYPALDSDDDQDHEDEDDWLEKDEDDEAEEIE